MDKGSSKRLVITLLKLLVGGGLLAYLIASGRLDISLLAFRTVSLPFVTAGLAIHGLASCLICFRYHLLLHAVSIPLSLTRVFRISL